MRLLIDGYNLMHAAGRMSRRFGPDGLRRARLRFLNELAMTLGAERSKRTTIVFDASRLPLNQAPESIHKGMTVIYAIDDDDADTRIERLIALDSAPRSLTVVSSDRRIRRAANRRRAISCSAENFLDFLDGLRQRPERSKSVAPARSESEAERVRWMKPTPDQVEAWVLEFGEDVATSKPHRDEDPSPSELWDDADLERIVEEVEAEFQNYVRPDFQKPRR